MKPHRSALLALRILTAPGLAIALFAACDRQERRTDTAPTPSRTEVNATPNEQAAITVQLGYQKIGAPFLLKSRSEGLASSLRARGAKPEWKEFKHGPALLEAMNANEVDVGYVGETPPVFAQAGGTSFVYAATDPPAPKAEAIVVLKDSPLRAVADLRGKKIALNRGSNVHYLLVKALAHGGLTMADVTVVYLAPGDARPAFETGQVDAWVIWDPFYAAAEQAGARTLIDGEGLVDNHLFYVVRRAFAEQHPDVVRAVLEEYRALSEWESQHGEEAATILAAASGISRDALLVAERRHAYGVRPVTDAVLVKQQAIADAFRKLDLIPKDIRVTDAYLPSVVYAAKP